MQDTAHAAGTSTARQGGPLEDPLEQASPRSRMRASLERAPSRSRGCASLERAPPHSRARSPSSSPVTPCTCSSTANAPSPRRGVGCTLDLLSCDLTGLGGGARPVGRHPCYCYGMVAAPRACGRMPGAVATTPALWNALERDAVLPTPVLRTGQRQQLPRAYQKTSPPSAALLPSNRHCSGTR
jgi:hypothetical protein